MKCIKTSGLFVCVFALVLNVSNVLAQLPHFYIMRTNLTYIGEKDLKKDVPVLFMYFSPTCDDCEEMTNTILSHIQELKDIPIVMVTNESISAIKEFVRKHEINQYENIIVGTEGNTLLFPRNYFSLEDFLTVKLPFLAFYDKKNKLVLKYDGSLPANDFILEVLNNYN